jgi:hypothetical protein
MLSAAPLPTHVSYKLFRCDSSYYAYVYPNRPYEIFLCNAFWSAPATGTDSKMGTIVHEMSHFIATADTDDNVSVCLVSPGIPLA